MTLELGHQLRLRGQACGFDRHFQLGGLYRAASCDLSEKRQDFVDLLLYAWNLLGGLDPMGGRGREDS